MDVSAEQIVSDVMQDNYPHKKEINYKYTLLFAEFLFANDVEVDIQIPSYKNKFQRIFYILSYLVNDLIIFRGSDDEVVWKIKKYGKIYPVFKVFSKGLKTSIKHHNLDTSTCVFECSVKMMSKFLNIPNITSQSFYRYYSPSELDFKRVESYRPHVLVNLPRIFDTYKKKIQNEYKLSSSIFMFGEIELFENQNTMIDLRYEYSKYIKKLFDKYDKYCILQLIIVTVIKDNNTHLHQNFLVFRKEGDNVEVDRYDPHGYGSITDDSKHYLNEYLSMIGNISKSELSFIQGRSESIQTMMNDNVGFCSTISMYIMLLFATSYILFDNTKLKVSEWISDIDIFVHRIIKNKSEIAFGYHDNKSMIYYYLFASIIECMYTSTKTNQ